MYKKSLSYPYLAWAAAFIIIPLLFIIYYGLTDKTGAFTLSNLAAVATAENSKAPSFKRKHTDTHTHTHTQTHRQNTVI